MSRLVFDGVEIDKAPFPDSRGTTQLYISDMPSVGKDKYNRLLDNGFESLNEIYQAHSSDITRIDGVGPKTAKNIKIWVGDKVVKTHEISDEQVAGASISKIAKLYNIDKNEAEEVRNRYRRKFDQSVSHISDIHAEKDS